MPQSTKDKNGDIRSIKTNLTARLDRIPWNSWHTYIFAILFAGVILFGYFLNKRPYFADNFCDEKLSISALTGGSFL